MNSVQRFPVLLLAVSAFTIDGLSHAQVTRVNVMPGYPNVPRTSSAQRRPVRPNDTLILWGSANNGDGTANGYTYTWSITAGPDLMYVDDGSLTGSVGDDSYITEEIAFSLLGGATSAIAAATLTVTDGTLTKQDTVEIQVISSTDPSQNNDTSGLLSPVKIQQVDVNIAIEDGLRHLYRRLKLNGYWQASTNQTIGPTGFAIWAMQNQGHLVTNSPDEDILAIPVQEGLDYLFQQIIYVNLLAAPNAPGQTSDLNNNQKSISFGPTMALYWGYEHCIATAALAASITPGRLVTVGNAAGKTYKEVGEDCLDLIGHAQGEQANARGGWGYNPNSWGSDMSINSWAYVAMDGLFVTFGVDVPDWILKECEYALVYHQDDNNPTFGPVLFGYVSPSPLCCPSSFGIATTGGGLSGLYAVENLMDPGSNPGQIISAPANAPLDSFQAKRDSALWHLGDNWGQPGCGIYSGNNGNTYAMWTVARALRLTAYGMGLPSGDVVQLTHQGVNFDWDTGEENNADVLAPSGSPREGYFSYLLRTQKSDSLNSVDDRGRWEFDCISSGGYGYGMDLDTAWAVLILTPKVFLVDPPNDDDDVDLGCVEFDRTETLTANDTLTLLTLAHNPEAAQGFSYLHAVDSEGDPVAFDHLIGQALVVDGVEYFDYSVNAVDYRAAVAEGSATDIDADGIRDLDGVEYEMTAGEILIPRFFGQSDGAADVTPFESELVLIGLTGGNQFTTTVDFLVYNDNEETFSVEHTFDCWDKVSLGEISGVFTNSFLRDLTGHDDREPFGFPQYETGWMRINGGIASSVTTSFQDPAIYAVLVEHTSTFGAADLPFEICKQTGELLPRSIFGDGRSRRLPEDCSASLRRREPASLLLMPEFDNRNGVVTVYSVTNTSPTDEVDVHFVYVGKYGS